MAVFVSAFSKRATERLALASIDEAARDRFISEHLPVCGCPYPARRLPHELRAAITHLLAMLRTEGAIPSIAAVDTKHDGELAASRAHMRDVGGLAVSTRARRERILQRFLQEQFPEGEISIAGLEPAHVRRFILGELQGWTTATIRIVGDRSVAISGFGR